MSLPSSLGVERYWQVPAPEAALPVVMLAPVPGAIQPQPVTVVVITLDRRAKRRVWELDSLCHRFEVG